MFAKVDFLYTITRATKEREGLCDQYAQGCAGVMGLARAGRS